MPRVENHDIRIAFGHFMETIQEMTYAVRNREDVQVAAESLLAQVNSAQTELEIAIQLGGIDAAEQLIVESREEIERLKGRG